MKNRKSKPTIIAISVISSLSLLSACAVSQNNNWCNSELFSQINADVKMRFEKRSSNEEFLIVSITNKGQVPFCLNLRERFHGAVGIEHLIEVTDQKGKVSALAVGASDGPFWSDISNEFLCFPTFTSKAEPINLEFKIGEDTIELEKGRYKASMRARLISPLTMWSTSPDYAVGYGKLKKLPECAYNYMDKQIFSETNFEID